MVAPTPTVKRKSKKRAIIFLAIVVIIATVAGIFYPQIKSLVLPKWEEFQYEKAISLIAEENYDEAKSILATLTNYSAEETNYLYAQISFQQSEYEEAANRWDDLGEYKDAADLSKEARYQFVLTLLAEEKYDVARPQLRKLGDYKNSAELVKECCYHLGMKSFNDGQYQNSFAYFHEAEDYGDSEEMAKQASLELENQQLEKQKSQAKQGISLQFVATNHFTTPGTFEVHSVTARLSEDSKWYTFEVDCTLPDNMNSSFFDPPNGNTFMIKDIDGKSGRNTYTYTISRAEVKSVASVTIKFFKSDNDRGYVLFNFKKNQLY